MQLSKYDYLNLAAESLIGVVSVFGNGLVLYVIYRNKSLRTFTNYLIASLATADMMVGVLGVPCVIINYIGLPRNFYGCLFTICMILIPTEISIFGLLAIAIERFLAIKYPLQHRKWLNGEVAAGVIVATWVAGFVVGLVPMFGWHLKPQGNTKDFQCAFVTVIDMKYMVYFNFLGFVLTPLLILFITYGYIFTIVRGRGRVITVASAENHGGSSTLTTKSSQTNQLRRESKAAKLIFLVLVMFTICWLPIHIMNCVTLWFNRTIIPAVIVGVLLSHANSCVNPFVYALTNAKFRKAFVTALRIRSPNAVSPMVQDNAEPSASAVGREERVKEVRGHNQ